MSWAAVIAGGVAIAGSVMQNNAAKDAGKKGAAGAQAGIDEQRRQFDLIMGLLAPNRGLGNQATNALARLYGYKPTMPGNIYGAGYNTPAPGDGNQFNSDGTRSLAQATDPLGLYSGGTVTADRILDPIGIFGSSSKKKKKKKEAAARAQAQLDQQNWIKHQQELEQQFQADQAAMPQGLDVFQASPDYQFRRGEGMRGIENSFAARGGAASGNALRALTEFNSNLASGEFGDFVNRQLAMAGMGQTANSQGASAAQYTGGNIANLLGQQANSRASGVINQSNAMTNGLNDLAGIYGAWMRNRQNSGGAGGVGTNWASMAANGGWS